MILKEFQQQAVDNIAKQIRYLITEQSKRKARGDSSPAHVILKSPTGSGKTIMSAEILRELEDFCDEQNIAVIWAAPNKLHEQSLKKLSIALTETRYSLINVDNITSGALAKNTILFSNWEKVFSYDKKAEEWKNKAVRQGEDGCNLQDILQASRDNGTRILLIVDESHQTFYGPNSQKFTEEIVKPDLIMEVSATPKTTLTTDEQAADRFYCEVINFSDIIDSELIKKTVTINQDIEQDAEISHDAIELILNSALDRREHLAQLYEDCKENVNPLLLIQLPTENSEKLSELDIADREIIERVLTNRGYSFKEGGDVAIWLADEKENLENIEQHLNQIKVLIFKQAIALGWDCPRAQVLCMLRDVKSETFRIQTVGRILRMPEAKHYSNDELNTAYVYTNMKDIAVAEDDEDAKNLIKLHTAKRNPLASSLTLPSIYLHRTDYGDLRADFKPILENLLDQTFDIDSKSDVVVGEENYNKLDQKLELYDEELTTPIIADVVIKNVDAYEAQEIKTIDIANDTATIERVFNNILRGYMGKFKNFARSKSIVAGTLYHWFNLSNISIEQVQKMLACSEANQIIFAEIFDKAISAYEDYNADEMKRRRQREIQHYDFEVPKQDEYSEHYETVHSIRNIMHPYYRRKDAPKTERTFEEMLDRSQSVEWWYKNGEKMERYFAVEYSFLDENAKSRRRAFYPDYIVRYTDGSTGIYDTKAWTTVTDPDTERKAHALQEFIRANQALGLSGGIIDAGQYNPFFLQDDIDYEPENKEKWKLFKI